MPSRTYSGATNPSGDGYGWEYVTYPYVKTVNVYKCPSNPYAALASNSASAGFAFPVSYAAYNQDDMNNSSTPPMPDSGTATVNIANIVSPAVSIDITESGPSTSSNMRTGAANGRLWGGHTGMGNYLFCDSHVKASRALATGTPRNFWTINDSPAVAPANFITALAAVDKTYNP